MCVTIGDLSGYRKPSIPGPDTADILKGELDDEKTKNAH